MLIYLWISIIQAIVAELFKLKRHSIGTILTNRKELLNLIKNFKTIHDSIKTIQGNQLIGKYNEKINHKGSMTFFPNINKLLEEKRSINILNMHNQKSVLR